jgi:hypothetical protein
MVLPTKKQKRVGETVASGLLAQETFVNCAGPAPRAPLQKDSLFVGRERNSERRGVTAALFHGPNQSARSNRRSSNQRTPFTMTNLPPQVEQYTQKVDAFMTKYPKLTMKGM